MPLANANGKHIVTVEGINKENGELTEAQNGDGRRIGHTMRFLHGRFVMSLTNFCIDETPKTVDSAISAIDGNLCRCTGYKSIERAALYDLCDTATRRTGDAEILDFAMQTKSFPNIFPALKKDCWRLQKPKTKNQKPKTKNQTILARAALICMFKNPTSWFIRTRKIFLIIPICDLSTKPTNSSKSARLSS